MWTRTPAWLRRNCRRQLRRLLTRIPTKTSWLSSIVDLLLWVLRLLAFLSFQAATSRGQSRFLPGRPVRHSSYSRLFRHSSTPTAPAPGRKSLYRQTVIAARCTSAARISWVPLAQVTTDTSCSQGTAVRTGRVSLATQAQWETYRYLW